MRWLSLLLVLFLLGACSSVGNRRTSGVMEYLHPASSNGAAHASLPAQQQDPRALLTTPLKLGLLCVPGARVDDVFGEERRTDLLARIAADLEQQPQVASVVLLPGGYVTPTGGFADLDRLSAAFDVDLFALVSYDQTQVVESNGWSVFYLTLIGCFFVPGEDTHTSTLLDVALVHGPSRALLGRASGTSQSDDSANAANSATRLRHESEAGFGAALEQLLPRLSAELSRLGREG